MLYFLLLNYSLLTNRVMPDCPSSPRAVSYPTPTYYAHLVAERARQHHNELASRYCTMDTRKDLL